MSKLTFKPDASRVWSKGSGPVLIDAMGQSKTVSFLYDGKVRIVEVHAIGLSSKGDVLVRGYQVGGSSSRPLPAWTLYSESKMAAVSFDEGIASQAPRPGYSQGDKQMAEVIVEIAE